MRLSTRQGYPKGRKWFATKKLDKLFFHHQAAASWGGFCVVHHPVDAGLRTFVSEFLINNDMLRWLVLDLLFATT